MLRSDQLTPGAYYEVVFDKGRPSEQVYIVKAEKRNWVKILWENGERKMNGRTGTVGSASRIREITEAHAMMGKFIPPTNEEALFMLQTGEPI
jgi:hypothetical protein